VKGISVEGKCITLSLERWNHIIERHPELEKWDRMVILTLEKPDFIQRGRKGEKLAFKKFTKTPVQEDKYMVVVYKEGTKEGFVITAFFTRRPSKIREIIWKQQ